MELSTENLTFYREELYSTWTCCVAHKIPPTLHICTKFPAVKFWPTVLKYMYFKYKVLYLVCTIFNSTVNFQNALKSNQLNISKRSLNYCLTCSTLWRSSHLYTLPESFLVSAALILWSYVFVLKWKKHFISLKEKIKEYTHTCSHTFL